MVSWHMQFNRVQQYTAIVRGQQLNVLLHSLNHALQRLDVPLARGV